MHHRRRRLEHAARACDIIHIPSGENIAKMATFVSALMGAPVAFAQVATTLEQAELAGLSPAKRAEVQARAVNGNTVDEVLQTVRLNSIKVRHPASRIVALDFLRGIAAVKTAGGRIEPNAIRYDHAGHNGLTSGPGDRTGGDLPMPRSAAPILRIVPGRAGSRRHVRLNRLFQPVKAGAVWPVLGHAGRSFFHDAAGRCRNRRRLWRDQRLTDRRWYQRSVHEGRRQDAAVRQYSPLPADPQDDDRQGGRSTSGYRRHLAAKLV